MKIFFGTMLSQSLGFKEWQIAYRNIFRNFRRSMALCMAMAFTVCGLTMLGGYIVRTEDLLRVIAVYFTQNGHISIYKKEGSKKFNLSPKKFQLTAKELQELNYILSAPDIAFNIKYSGELLNGFGVLSKDHRSFPFLAVGVGRGLNEKIAKEEKVQKWMDELGFSGLSLGFSQNKNVGNDNSHISVTKTLAELIGLEFPLQNNSFEKREVQLGGRNVFGDLNAVNASVEHIHTTGISLQEDTSILVPIELLRELMSFEGARNISIFLKDDQLLQKNLDWLNQYFLSKSLHFEALPFYHEDIGEFYIGSMGFMSVLTFFFVVMIYAAGLLSLINTLSMNIIERTKEIGTLRSIGYKKEIIAKIFMKETLIIALFSLIVGNVMIEIGSAIINSLKLTMEPPYIPGTMNFMIFSNVKIRLFVAIPLTAIVTVSSYYITKSKMKKSIISNLNDEVR